MRFIIFILLTISFNLIFGQSKIYNAVVANDIARVKWLIDKKNPVNEYDNLDYIPLHAAVLNGEAAMINMLIKAGAEINQVNDLGYSAVMVAAEKSKLQAIKCLVEQHKANTEIKGADGNTALMLAVLKGDILTSKTLIDVGASVNATDKNSRTPLMKAVEHGKNQEIVKLLVENGAAINAKDKDGLTAFMHAAAKNNFDYVKLFKTLGCDINAKNNEGATALILAVKRGNMDCVKFLAEMDGINLNIADNAGKTALAHAQILPDIRDFLKTKGAQ